MTPRLSPKCQHTSTPPICLRFPVKGNKQTEHKAAHSLQSHASHKRPAAQPQVTSFLDTNITISVGEELSEPTRGAVANCHVISIEISLFTGSLLHIVREQSFDTSYNAFARIYKTGFLNQADLCPSVWAVDLWPERLRASSPPTRWDGGAAVPRRRPTFDRNGPRRGRDDLLSRRHRASRAFCCARGEPRRVMTVNAMALFHWRDQASHPLPPSD